MKREYDLIDVSSQTIYEFAGSFNNIKTGIARFNEGVNYCSRNLSSGYSGDLSWAFDTIKSVLNDMENLAEEYDKVYESAVEKADFIYYELEQD